MKEISNHDLDLLIELCWKRTVLEFKVKNIADKVMDEFMDDLNKKYERR